MSHVSSELFTKIVDAIASAPINGFNGYSTIPIGAVCFQDFRFFRWPGEFDPETMFHISTKGENMTFKAPGLGESGDYGNGAILMKMAHWREVRGIAP